MRINRTRHISIHACSQYSAQIHDFVFHLYIYIYTWMCVPIYVYVLHVFAYIMTFTYGSATGFRRNFNGPAAKAAGVPKTEKEREKERERDRERGREIAVAIPAQRLFSSRSRTFSKTSCSFHGSHEGDEGCRHPAG